MNRAQILSFADSLWDTTLNTPPFIAIDQEGGRVHRLPSAFTHFPAAAEIGARRDRDLAYRCGRAAADRIGTGWNQPQLCSGTGCQLESAAIPLSAIARSATSRSK